MTSNISALIELNKKDRERSRREKTTSEQEIQQVKRKLVNKTHRTNKSLRNALPHCLSSRKGTENGHCVGTGVLDTFIRQINLVDLNGNEHQLEITLNDQIYFIFMFCYLRL